ncbi:MAG: tetrathionate reductase subunit A [Lautropia sp.]|nr:tetrathionate reductase subunit A [Lautropia sp.]
MTDQTRRPKTGPEKQRRHLLRGGLAAGGAAAFVAGYGETLLKGVKGLTQGTSGVPTADATRGNSLQPEYRIDPATGSLSTQPGQVVSPSSCLGCWTQCGVRVRIDTENNRILRVAGNPYHPLATTRPAPMNTPVREVYAMLGGDDGLEGRATSCARGSSMLEHQTAPHRVLHPLKRVGPRGSGQWQRISFETLIEEICEGGDLFGEGHVDGLRAIRDTQTLIDPDNPEFGPRANQLMVTDASNEGRTPLLKRFANQAFGTINVANHGAYCGQSYRVGTAAALGNIPGMKHGKPDWKNSRFGLFLGTAPAQAGNPFQRQGRELAEARSRDEQTYRYVVVSPLLPTSSSHAAGDNNRWMAVKPGTDLALAMGLIRWIIDNERYDARFLSQPGPVAMKAAGEASWSNATHLLINDPEHPRYGQFLRGADLGWPMPAAAPATAAGAGAGAGAGKDARAADGKAAAGADKAAEPVGDVYVVQLADGSLVPHTTAQPAELFVERTITPVATTEQPAPAPLSVCSALAKLRAEAHRKSLAEYAALCGVPEAGIEALAREFTSHGKQAVANSHGGTMSGAGFYTAYAIAMLNNLIGNLNVKGGWVLDAGPFGPFGPGPCYNFKTFPGAIKPAGVALSRTRFAYEKTSEFKRRKASGQNPYPAQAPWYPAPGPMSSEMLAAGLMGYPYPVKAWINHMSNPVYSICGFENALVASLKDTRKLPLFISVDPFINETSALADYIVPDTVTYESWGIGVPWADVIAKTSTVRWPVVEPPNAKTADGRPVNFDSFIFAVARRLNLPGFGRNGMSTKAGEPLDLDTPEAFYLRAICNIAHQAGQPVPEASDDDIDITGLTRWMPTLQQYLQPEQVRRVAMVMSRGGRFDNVDAAWQGDHIKAQYAYPVQIWHEPLARMRHAMTGERYSGCPTWYPTRFADGTAMRSLYPEQDWPLTLCSYKSNLMSSMSIGVSRLRQVHPHNPVSINREDAEALGIRNGDRIRVSTPGGSREGVALVRGGIARGAVAIEFGYGHTALGTTAHIVDGQPMPHNPQHGRGINLNALGFTDPTRPAHDNIWVDWVSGAVVRQGLPARVEKI